MNLEEAIAVLEENGYLLLTCWTIDDIKNRVEDVYYDTFYTTFTDVDYTNIANKLIRSIDWKDGVSRSTIDNVIEEYAFERMIDSIPNNDNNK